MTPRLIPRRRGMLVSRGKTGVMDIRPTRMQDAPEIAVVHVLSWQAAYRGLLPQAYLDGLDPLSGSAGGNGPCPRQAGLMAGLWLLTRR